MPRKLLNRVSPIPDVQKRKVAFCRMKKDLLKRSMELSQMCDMQVLLVVYDEQKSRMTLYQSQEEFDLTRVHMCKKEAKEPENIHKFERFTNSDYKSIISKDFRTVRYHREEFY